MVSSGCMNLKYSGAYTSCVPPPGTVIFNAFFLASSASISAFMESMSSPFFSARFTRFSQSLAACSFCRASSRAPLNSTRSVSMPHTSSWLGSVRLYPNAIIRVSCLMRVVSVMKYSRVSSVATVFSLAHSAMSMSDCGPLRSVICGSESAGAENCIVRRFLSGRW